MTRFDQLPPAAGLYDPAHERDACGTGFVADLNGPSRRVLQTALDALACMDHRGGVGADGQSGDGAGVLTDLPYPLLAEALPDPSLARPGAIAVAMCMLPKDPDARAAIAAVIESELAREGVGLLAWREVPTDNDVLGDDALASRPILRQALLGRPARLPAWAEAGPEPFERLLYIVRRRIERRVLRDNLGPLHIASMSSRTLVYKGLLLSSDLATFYPDLRDSRFVTSVAVVHQRFSTNTFPTWSLAQPFRFLAHNGEINTLDGNRSWQEARTWAPEDAGWGEAWADIVGLLPKDGSDSACLDTMLELLTLSGDGLLHAIRALVQPAWWGRGLPPALTAAFRYLEARMEPWDGPAALVMSDGDVAVAAQDRNGLRPLRWCRTTGGLVMAASEAGIFRLDGDTVLEHGRLGPGDLLAVDLRAGEVLRTDGIHARLAAMHPWEAWTAGQVPLGGDPADHDPLPHAPLPLLKQFGFGLEDTERVLHAMATTGHGPVGSMGDDTPLAALSTRPQSLYRFFKQRFAQVTNPPIDSQREASVMSLDTLAGPRPRLLQAHGVTNLVRCRSPLVSAGQHRWLAGQLTEVRLATLLRREDDLDDRLAALVGEAEAAVRAGATLLTLSDHGVDADHAPLPALLAVSAVHHHLVRAGLRHDTTLLVHSGEPVEDHHFACLIGFGADLVHPWLAWPSAVQAAPDLPPAEALAGFRRAVEGGLRKIMAKVGVSCVASYRGARLFEILGLARPLCDRWLPGPTSRVGGVGADALRRDLWRLHDAAWTDPGPLTEHGRYRWRRDGEHHALSPQTARLLHKAVRTGDVSAWQRYVEQVEHGPTTTLRDLLTLRPSPAPVPLDEVESAASIARRFCTGAMSLGSLSAEAHEALAVGMNRLGGRSNSGEGGEDPARHRRLAEDAAASGDAWRPRAGDDAHSAIKQVASARFGVSASYLVSADELEIKMAQGSKPGEGGQIPGDKVSAEIARLRRASPGVTLISPPPHHDIYSIEDLAQLIFDLKRVHDRAPVGVKLVARAGVGTIAAGVVKAGADVVHLSGADGGTGASPLSSVKHAGLPWEIGLAEVQQTLVRNRLRGRVTLRVDGGLRTGRDVLLAALLGAEEFAFGTTALVAIGCVMARQCHSNTCPVGVATQRAELRARFPGTPEHLIAMMLFIAEEVRHGLARLGFHTLQQAVGRVDRLVPRPEAAAFGLDLSPLLVDLGGRADARHKQGPARSAPRNTGLDAEIGEAVRAALDAGVPFTGAWKVTNRDRTLGARAAGEVARRFGDDGLPAGTIRLRLHGTAGQSLGAFLPSGVHVELDGQAQDGVAKGLCGGEVVVRAHTVDPNPVLAGNALLYGATGGRLFVAGRVGERLAVRNSGAVAVVEGCGDHAAEYMTGGAVAVLGRCGFNVGAGMTGGRVWLLDPDPGVAGRLSADAAVVEATPEDVDACHALLLEHLAATSSQRAARLLDRWGEAARHLVVVVPAGVAALRAQRRAG